MNRTNVALQTSREPKLGQIVKPGVFLLLLMMSVRPGLAQEAGPKTFSSAGEAAHSLFLAVRNEDEQAVGAILGVGKEVTSSNDDAEDRLERERFTQKYQEMHRLVAEPDGKTVLYVGAENWPFPIPLVSKNGRWYFDSDAGTQEMLFRTIGENETTAIEVCRAFAAAMKHETKAIADDQISQYAETMVFKSRSSGDTTGAERDLSPFHGYYFQIAKQQTRDAAAGSNAYVSLGKKSGQVVLIAVPAEYRRSGVMTFIVSQDGIVYQKDIGADTARFAPALLEKHFAKSRWQAVN